MNRIPTPQLAYKNEELYLEDCALQRVAAEVDTPAYIYSRRHIEEQFRAYEQALEGIPHLICYGMKACSNLGIVKLLGELGAGMDLVSGGELYRAQLAGIAPQRMIFSGVGKTEEEIRRAVRAGILMLNVESQAELQAISRVSQEEGRTAGISIRINPDIDAHTHPYISTGLEKNKFGIPFEEALEMYEEAQQLPGLEIRGLQSHIGSQITEIEVFSEALDKLLEVHQLLQEHGIAVRYLDLGGGLGIAYQTEPVAGPAEMISPLLDRLRSADLTILFEPGRSIVGNSCVLLTRVVYYKENRQKRFAIVDCGMTELLRPALYGAYHQVVPVRQLDREAVQVDVAGPICESTDMLAKDRVLPRPRPGDLYAVLSAGAYASCMASNYNSRPRPPEILVEGDRYRIVRQRETYEDLTAKELLAIREEQ